MLNLAELPPADLIYLNLVVGAGRVPLRGRSKPTWFAKEWLRQYASEHAGVWYDEKRRQLKYYWLENDVEQLCLDR
jgi:hypothetical protein